MGNSTGFWQLRIEFSAHSYLQGVSLQKGCNPFVQCNGHHQCFQFGQEKTMILNNARFCEFLEDQLNECPSFKEGGDCGVVCSLGETCLVQSYATGCSANYYFRRYIIMDETQHGCTAECVLTHWSVVGCDVISAFLIDCKLAEICVSSTMSVSRIKLDSI